MMKIRKLFQGWRFSWCWYWQNTLAAKMIWATFCHIGIEAGTYKGNYIELTVVILGAGFDVQWYPPTESQDEFIDEMNERVAEAKEQFGITEDAT